MNFQYQASRKRQKVGKITHKVDNKDVQRDFMW